MTPRTDRDERTRRATSGTFTQISDLTVDQACDLWLAGRRGIRPNTLQGYKNALKPVRRRLGGKKLRDVSKHDGDALVEWMLTEGRQSPRHYRTESLSSRIATFIAEHPSGVSAATIKTAFPDADVHTALSGLIRSGRVKRLRRGFYSAVDIAKLAPTQPGVKPITVRSTLVTFNSVMESFVAQGKLARNPIALVQPPNDTIDDEDSTDDTSKSWTVAEVP
ncbi:hypothetical protein [Nocardia sp. NPDC050793]|uniref:hypothetical protein n=1 Tax=Nocardia sp. NPDC050793 TaxID=3155159 RepID=UPI0034052F97